MLSHAIYAQVAWLFASPANVASIIWHPNALPTRGMRPSPARLWWSLQSRNGVAFRCGGPQATMSHELQRRVGLRKPRFNGANRRNTREGVLGHALVPPTITLPGPMLLLSATLGVGLPRMHWQPYRR